MRIGDVGLGAALLLAGLSILVVARGFPTMAGLPYGPGLFPSIAAVGLMACGALVALSGWRGGRSRSRVEPGTRLGTSGAVGAEAGGDPDDGRTAGPAAEEIATARGRFAAVASPASGPGGEASVGASPSPAGALRVVVVPLSVVFFGLALDGLGFHVTAAAALAGLFLAFGLGPLRAGAFAVAAALAIHGVFYSLLRVPLPWGVLTPVAW